MAMFLKTNSHPGSPDRAAQNADPSDSHDVMKDFSYYRLFEASERQLWKLSDIPWDKIEKQMVPPGLLAIIREMAYGELTTYSATRSFMEMFADDLDFTQWLSLWFYEETKHPLSLMKWLSYFEDRFDSEFIRKGREIHPMREDKLETLCMNIVSEVTAARAYNGFYETVAEPVLKQIMRQLSIDETRHANGFFAYARKMILQHASPPAAKLSALRVLFFCLYSTEQHHPVNETMRYIQNELADSTVRPGLDHPDTQKLLLHKFGQLTGLSLSSKEDVIANIQRLRTEAGEMPEASPRDL